MFIKTNDRLVNLNNVSNINIVHDEKRIVFNLNYGIEINSHGVEKTISDYVYLDTRNDKDFENALYELYMNEYIANNFITHDFGYININEISSIKFSDHKKRVIFNLSHSVTFQDYRNNEIKLTSEFVYVDFDEFKDYRNYAFTIKNTMMERT